MRKLCLAAAGLIWLAACETTSPVTGYQGPAVAPFTAGSPVLPITLSDPEVADQRFDILFVADGASYNGLATEADKAAFRADIEALRMQGFDQLAVFRDNPEYFSYFELTVPGDLRTDQPCPTNLGMPKSVLDEHARFADAVLLVHRNPDHRDCADIHKGWGSVGTVMVADPAGSGRQIAVPEYATAVHEVAHMLFRLPDEYREGGFWITEPTGVVFFDQAQCQAYRDRARLPGVPPTERCARLGSGGASGVTWYRLDGRRTDVMSSSDPLTVSPMGPADWAQTERLLRNLEGDAPIQPPDIAPPFGDDGPSS